MNREYCSIMGIAIKYLFIAIISILLIGCSRITTTTGVPFSSIEVQPGKTTRTEILKAMGPPQLFDMTQAGDLGTSYLLYEARFGKSWAISPIVINYAINTERTDTLVFYFDDDGILRSYGLSRNTPTTKRQAFTILFPFALSAMVK